MPCPSLSRLTSKGWGMTTGVPGPACKHHIQRQLSKVLLPLPGVPANQPVCLFGHAIRGWGKISILNLAVCYPHIRTPQEREEGVWKQEPHTTTTRESGWVSGMGFQKNQLAAGMAELGIWVKGKQLKFKINTEGIWVCHACLLLGEPKAR